MISDLVYIFAPLFVFASLLLWAVVLHELGHYLYFRLALKKNPNLTIDFSKRRISLGAVSDYKGVPLLHKIFLNVSGIVLGFLPLAVFFPRSLDNLFDISMVYLVGIYFFGCINDFVRIIDYVVKLVKEAEFEDD